MIAEVEVVPVVARITKTQPLINLGQSKIRQLDLMHKLAMPDREMKKI